MYWLRVIVIIKFYTDTAKETNKEQNYFALWYISILVNEMTHDYINQLAKQALPRNLHIDRHKTQGWS